MASKKGNIYAEKDDYLAGIPEIEVAAWYRRLADKIGEERIRGKEPYASMFLRHWLDNRNLDSTFMFNVRDYVLDSLSVHAALLYHRAVFLTQKKARYTGKAEAWAGVILRLQGLNGFARWDLVQPIKMHYECLVDVAPNVIELARIKSTGTPEEKDLLTSLRGFQIRSDVVLSGMKAPNSKVQVSFVSWVCRISDRYDFNYSEYFTVPNPDYMSSREGAVQPKEKKIRVYHSNALRLEKARLAAPYYLKSNEWKVSEGQIVGEAQVDPMQKI